MPRPPLTVAQILAWADDHYRRTGGWPKEDSGPVPANLNEKWMNVANALRLGLRGLPGRDSLAKLLDRERGVRNVRDLPRLTEGVILLWATAHQQRTGSWPTEDSGPITGTNGEVW